jgi:hypothetical protein
MRRGSSSRHLDSGGVVPPFVAAGAEPLPPYSGEAIGVPATPVHMHAVPHDDIPVATMVAPPDQPHEHVVWPAPAPYPHPHLQPQYPPPTPHSPPHELPQAQVVAVHGEQPGGGVYMLPPPQPPPPPHATFLLTTIRTTTHVRGVPVHVPQQRVVVARQSAEQRFHAYSAFVFGFGWCVPLIWGAAIFMACVPNQAGPTKCLNVASSLLFTVFIICATALVLVYVVYNLPGVCDSGDWVDRHCRDSQACSYDQCTDCPSDGVTGCEDWTALSKNALDVFETALQAGLYSCQRWC